MELLRKYHNLSLVMVGKSRSTTGNGKHASTAMVKATQSRIAEMKSYLDPIRG